MRAFTLIKIYPEGMHNYDFYVSKSMKKQM